MLCFLNAPVCVPFAGPIDPRWMSTRAPRRAAAPTGQRLPLADTRPLTALTDTPDLGRPLDRVKSLGLDTLDT